jgi:hypothetical protein
VAGPVPHPRRAQFRRRGWAPPGDRARSAVQRPAHLYNPLHRARRSGAAEPLAHNRAVTACSSPAPVVVYEWFPPCQGLESGQAFR